MAILKNKTQNNFTMISNNVLRDKELSLKDRGVLCTLFSLPDGWKFSIGGLSAIVPDGVHAIRTSIVNLENLGYMERTKARGEDGKYISEIEVFTERRTVCDYPSRVTRHGFSVAENQREYNTDNIKKKSNTGDIKSIPPFDESPTNDRQKEINSYKELIADNIKLDWLLEVASQRNATEEQMVHEIYNVICDMVCYPREKVYIKGTSYPWTTVKSRFLKLGYPHIADVLNRIIDSDLNIKNMSAYLVSTLYTQSLVGTIQNQLNAIFNHAVKYYDLAKNPCIANKKMGKAKAKEMQFWTKEEYLKFSRAIMDKPISYYAFQILYWTGIRCGELLALTKADFDLENRKLKINKTYQVVKGKEMITSPKTEKSNRTIELPEFLCEEMQDYFDSLYKIGDNSRIFEVTKSYLHHEMDRGSKAANIKRIRIHDLRHSSCALLINLGYSPVEIAERLGHESVTITDRYAHLYPSVQRDMANRLDEAFKEGEEDD